MNKVEKEKMSTQILTLPIDNRVYTMSIASFGSGFCP